MKSVILLRFVWLMVLFTCTKEIPLDAEEVESDIRTDSSDVDWDSRLSTEESGTLRMDRWNHSRMLEKTSTTLNYDEWWFFTTRRPIISYKDFPGRPGVATWKEISPGSTTENRNSRKIKTPAAEEVSSGSSTDAHHSIMPVFLALLLALRNIGPQLLLHRIPG